MNDNNNLVMNKRKTFYYNNDESKPITASGILFYRNPKKMEILLIESDGMFEDIGGKTESFDETVFETVIREVEEETNGVIKITDEGRLNNSIYVPRAKYELFIVEADKFEKELESDIFGDKEIHDNYNRKIKWIEKEKILDKTVFKFKLNYRLKSLELFNRLSKIETEAKLKKNMFKVVKKNKTVKKEVLN